MSVVGSSADNALAESFNAACKWETLQGRGAWADERAARLDLFRWLHRYNIRRRHSSLGQRSPIAYDTALATIPGQRPKAWTAATPPRGTRGMDRP
ncbi:integrase core domain-containing protein [Streptomyces sp. NPDC058272]|uniref:integrase core domain-containing protein n=1 Tax=Streptomyces sp. NPDC058272 TaxID=3346415 RepID=UPI0036E344DE